jgi:hypothetical protein
MEIMNDLSQENYLTENSKSKSIEESFNFF